MGFVVLSFLILISSDFLISYLAPFFIPYLGFFPYTDFLKKFHLPNFITAQANFDGVHYLKIASKGYEQYTQAFFPLYPLSIHYVSRFFNTVNYLIVALLISNIFFFFGLFIFKKYLEQFLPKEKVFWTIIFLLTFPTSFFLHAVYPHGLFIFALASSLLFMRKKKYLLASFAAALSSTIRLIGIFIFIPFLLTIFNDKKRKIIHFLYALTPFIGLAAYSIYLYKTTGDPFYFFNSQPAFGANRSTSLISLPQVYFRYLKIFTSASLNFQFLVSLFEFFVFTFVFGCLLWQLKTLLKEKNKNTDLLGLNLFSIAAILLPTLTGTFSSIPRYALEAPAFFIFLAQIKNIKIKFSLVLVFAILHVVLLAFFTQGYFVS